MNKQEILRDLALTEESLLLINSKCNKELDNITNTYKKELSILRNNINKFYEECIMSNELQDKISNMVLNMRILIEKIQSTSKQTSNI